MKLKHLKQWFNLLQIKYEMVKKDYGYLVRYSSPLTTKSRISCYFTESEMSTLITEPNTEEKIEFWCLYDLFIKLNKKSNHYTYYPMDFSKTTFYPDFIKRHKIRYKYAHEENLYLLYKMETESVFPSNGWLYYTNDNKFTEWKGTRFVTGDLNTLTNENCDSLEIKYKFMQLASTLWDRLEDKKQLLTTLANF